MKTDAVVSDGHLLLKIELTRPVKLVMGYKSFRYGEARDWEYELPHCRYVAQATCSHERILIHNVKAAEARCEWIEMCKPEMLDFIRTRACSKWSSAWKVDLVEQGKLVLVRVTRLTDLGDIIDPWTSPQWPALLGERVRWGQGSAHELETP